MMSFAAVYPDLIEEWAEENEFGPDEVSYGSNRMIVWNGACGHTWAATAKNRGNGSGCPYCSGNKVLKGFNDLATLHPELAAEWSDSNYGLQPYDVSARSDKKVWWICSRCGQEWMGRIADRSEGHGSPVRSCEDIDDAALTYAEVKALATGNPYIKEKMDLDIQVSKLKLMKANHTSQKYRLEDDISQRYPRQISALKEKIEGLKADIADYNAKKPADKEQFAMTVAGKTYEDRKEAGTALIAVCKEMKAVNTPVSVGEYLGMKMAASFDSFSRKFTLTLKGNMTHSVDVGSDPSGNITRINNVLEGMGKQLEEAVSKLENVEHQLETAKVEVGKPFPQEAELAEKLDRLAELNALLNMDEKGDDAVGMDDDTPKPEQANENAGHSEANAEQTHEDATQSRTEHTVAVTYVDNTVELRKASEPKVEYGSNVSEPVTGYTAVKAEKPEKPELKEKSGKPFHDKLEAKKGEIAKVPQKKAEVKSKQTSL